MRELTAKEKEIVKNLITLKKNKELLELQTALILRKKSSNFLAIKWKSNDRYSLSIYYNADNSNPQINLQQQNEALARYFEICDYLYFIRELEENKMITIQTIYSENPKQEIKTLVDKNFFEYNVNDDKFYNKIVHDTPKELKPLTAAHWSFQKIYTDIVVLLDSLLDNKIIYPLPLLEDLVENNYESIEDRRFNEQMCWTRLSVFIASIAVIFTVIFEGFNSKTTLDDNQLKSLEQAILSNKLIIDDYDSINLADTLKLRIPSNNAL